MTSLVSPYKKNKSSNVDSVPTVGLLTNETKPAALEAAQSLAQELHRRQVRVLARPVVAREMERQCHEATDDAIAQADFVVVFGGDGTLLSAARMVAPFETPILGVHLGNFGFITEVAREDLFSAVDAVLAGNFHVEERVMLSAVMERSNTDISRPMLAVNDIVVGSAAKRMVHIHTAIGSVSLATYAADGVIVSTPTGSTGYSLSAGGPLVHPSVAALIIAPICPHTLNARPIVVPVEEEIALRLEPATRDRGIVTLDGQIEHTLHPGETVRILRAPYCVRILSVDGPNFYQKIRSRWHYGERETA